MSEQLRKLKDKATKYQLKGKLEKSLKLYLEAKSLAPKDIHIRQKIAEIHSRMGCKDAAIREFQHIAGHYASEGLFLKAVAICKVIFSLDPAHTETQRTLAELYGDAMKFEEPRESRYQLPVSMSEAVGREPARDTVSSASAEDVPLPPTLEDLDDDETVKASMDHLPFDETSEARSAVINSTTLPRVPLFSSLPLDAAVTLIERVLMVRTQAGERIVVEGEPGKAMFVVIQGEFDVVRGAESDEARLAARLGPGSFFGEMALVAHSPRFATVVGRDEGVLLELDRKTLDEICQEHPSVRGAIEDHFFSRLIDTIELTSPIFGSFSDEARRLLVESCQVVDVQGGTTVLEQDHPGGGVYLVLRGRCDVTRRDEDDIERPLAELGVGEVFGEISTMLHKTCTATVRTACETVLLQIPPEPFRKVFLNYDDVLFTMDDLLESRLSQVGLSSADFL